MIYKEQLFHKKYHESKKRFQGLLPQSKTMLFH
jgi:hypothetical protein